MFISQVIFGKLYERMDIIFKFFTAYHLQTDGQTEAINQSLEVLVWYLEDEHLTTGIALTMAEFAYNSLVNRTTRLSSFEIVTGYKSRKL